jgi:hypothetical protein
MRLAVDLAAGHQVTETLRIDHPTLAVLPASENLLAITILATAGPMDRRDTTPPIPACWALELRGDRERGG